MNKEQLKKQIIDANNAYRKGETLMSDSQFDELVEQYKELVSIDEYNEFRDSLNESFVEFGTKIKHKYVMGSLDKIKNSDNSTLYKFIKNHVKNTLNISAKVDGISSVACYKYGKLTYLLSRGNGYEGMDYTDKAKYINGLPDKVDLFTKNPEIYIRGELVILDSEEIDTDTNYRNICAGYMNSKYWKKEDISKVSFIPYSILGDKATKRTQFEVLNSVGFNCTWNESIDITEYDETNISDLAEYLTERAKLKHDYSCDGLVLMDLDAYNEQDVYRPKNSMAFKINELNAVTKVIDISWDGPSKDGFMIPVAILEPVEIGGAIISRASVHNLDVLNTLNIKYGSIVEINKANDIIPQISKVISNDNTTDIIYPTICPCCGEMLVKDINDINYKCNNKTCRVQMISKIEHFIKSLNVENASFKTLEKFGIDTFEKLLEFRPDDTKKSEVKFMRELSSKVFTASEDKLFCAMNMRGLGQKILRKIIDFYTWDIIKSSVINNNVLPSDMPFGVGDILIEKFKAAYADNVNNVFKFVNDPRYTGHNNDTTQKIVDIKKGSICFTGSLSTMSRKVASDKAINAGYELKTSVGKGLTYLVTNDPNSGSSKNEKAKKLGVKVIDEQEFISLVSVNKIDSDIMDF